MHLVVVSHIAFQFNIKIKCQNMTSVFCCLFVLQEMKCVFCNAPIIKIIQQLNDVPQFIRLAVQNNGGGLVLLYPRNNLRTNVK